MYADTDESNIPPKVSLKAKKNSFLRKMRVLRKMNIYSYLQY